LLGSGTFLFGKLFPRGGKIKASIQSTNLIMDWTKGSGVDLGLPPGHGFGRPLSSAAAEGGWKKVKKRASIQPREKNELPEKVSSVRN